MISNGIKNAYALLGLSFLIVFVGAYFVIEKANAPTDREILDPTSSYIESDNLPHMMTLTSPAFNDNELMPSRHSCDGENISPEIHISGVPEGTESLVLLMDDPDIPENVKESMGIEKFDHWALYNIPPGTTVIPEGEIVGIPGLNSRAEAKFTGACPPDGEHRYMYRLYAVSTILEFTDVPTLDQIEATVEASALESAALMGRYSRN